MKKTYTFANALKKAKNTHSVIGLAGCAEEGCWSYHATVTDGQLVAAKKHCGIRGGFGVKFGGPMASKNWRWDGYPNATTAEVSNFVAELKRALHENPEIKDPAGHDWKDLDACKPDDTRTILI